MGRRKNLWRNSREGSFFYNPIVKDCCPSNTNKINKYKPTGLRSSNPRLSRRKNKYLTPNLKWRNLKNSFINNQIRAWRKGRGRIKIWMFPFQKSMMTITRKRKQMEERVRKNFHRSLRFLRKKLLSLKKRKRRWRNLMKRITNKTNLQRK